MRKGLVTLLAAAGLAVLSGTAAAHTSIGVGISLGVPAPVYVAPRPVYYPPAYVAAPPAYIAPAPVYYGPPAYVAPAPVYYGPPAVVYGRGWHRGWHHHRW